MRMWKRNLKLSWKNSSVTNEKLWREGGMITGRKMRRRRRDRVQRTIQQGRETEEYSVL